METKDCNEIHGLYNVCKLLFITAYGHLNIVFEEGR